MEINSLKELFIQLKIRFYTFISNTVINIHSLEGIVLGLLLHYFPNNAKEISEFFVVYLGFKSTK